MKATWVKWGGGFNWREERSSKGERESDKQNVWKGFKI